MKHCFKCGDVKPLAEFYPHPRMADGHLGKCIACSKAYAKARYHARADEFAAYERKRSQDPKRRAQMLVYQRTRRARHPEKYKAWNAVTIALKSGALIRQPCEVCGSAVDVQAHHDDYSRPLDVRWLCFDHHRAAHGQRTYPSVG